MKRGLQAEGAHVRVEQGPRLCDKTLVGRVPVENGEAARGAHLGPAGEKPTGVPTPLCRLCVGAFRSPRARKRGKHFLSSLD